MCHFRRSCLTFVFVSYQMAPSARRHVGARVVVYLIQSFLVGGTCVWLSDFEDASSFIIHCFPVGIPRFPTPLCRLSNLSLIFASLVHRLGINPFCACFCACCITKHPVDTGCPRSVRKFYPSGGHRIGKTCYAGTTCHTLYDPQDPETFDLIGVTPYSKEGLQQTYLRRFGLSGNFISEETTRKFFDSIFFEKCAPAGRPSF